MKVLNFGSLNLDYVYQVDHFTKPGETQSAFSQTVNPGGKGLNQSIALKKAGIDVFHAGCVGKGGQMLKDLLDESEVKTEYLYPCDEIQGNAVIQVDPKGQNSILLFGGSNQSITETQIIRTLSHFSAGDYLVLQNEINDLPMIVEKAYETGMVIIFNPSPCNEKIKDIDLKKISWLLINEIEMMQLTGSDQPEEAWHILSEKYLDMKLLLTMGAEGSFVFTAKKRKYQKAIPVKAVDTTAAGDTYTGYFVAGLCEGLTLEECMLRASMAAAISVTRPGAAGSIPSRKEVEEALKNLE